MNYATCPAGMVGGFDGPSDLMGRPSRRSPLRARFPKHVAVLRVQSSFANADAVRARIRQAATADRINAVVFDAKPISFIDVTSARMLAERIDELQQRAFNWRKRAGHQD